MLSFSPGDLVRARGREWVASPSAARRAFLRFARCQETRTTSLFWTPRWKSHRSRPRGSICPRMHATTVQAKAALLADALRLTLRRGAGPFRSAAQLAFEPRTYQLVPLAHGTQASGATTADRGRCRYRQDHRSGPDPAGVHGSRRSRCILGSLPAPPRGSVDYRAQGSVRNRRSRGDFRHSGTPRAKSTARSDPLRRLPLHGCQPRLHQGREAPGGVRAGLSRLRDR